MSFQLSINALRFKKGIFENNKEPALLIETILNTIDLVSMDLKRGIKIEINNDV